MCQITYFPAKHIRNTHALISKVNDLCLSTQVLMCYSISLNCATQMQKGYLKIDGGQWPEIVDYYRW